jgi:hypothetical protein
MNFLASLALFLTPSIYFLIQNLGLGKVNELISAVIVSITLFCVGVFLTSPLLFLKKKNFFFLTITFISSFWYLQFLIPNLIHANNFFIQLAAVTLFSLLIVIISIKINISNFVLIFIGLNLLVQVILKIDYLYTALNKNIQTNESSSLIKTIPKVRDVNIYYVLADGLTSLKELNQTYKVPINQLEKNLKNYKFTVFDDSKSSYNITYLTLASIFSLDYPVIEGSPKYKDRLDFFPDMLSTPNRVPLLVKLASLDYKFFHIGNQWASCSQNELVNCLSNNYDVPLNFYIAKLSENYSIQTFLKKTIFERITSNILNENKIEYEAYKKEINSSLNKNDALGTIINAIKFKSLNLSGSIFYFVHHLNPHPPALNKDCSLTDDKDYLKWTALNYSESSKCAVNRISELIRVLNEADPRAIVVIQGDHGPAITYSFDKDLEKISEKGLQERFSIFNAVKLPEGCILPSVKNLGNVETIQLIVDCIAGTKVANEYSKSYASFYEKHKNFGQVFQINFKGLMNPQP